MRKAKMGGVLALSWAAAIGNATAAERLVMPYVCTPHAGSVELDRSNLRSYEIIGRVDESSYTHCAPNSPDRCKTWPVYRFHLDCGGARVPWYKVVAAASELNNGPAFARDGRLAIRMRPARRQPAYGPPGSPRDVAVLPHGFAPIIAMKAEIIGEPAYGQSEGPPSGETLAWQKSASPPPPSPKPQTATEPKAADVIRPPVPTPAKNPAVKADANAAKAEAGKPQAQPPNTTSTPGLKILNEPGKNDTKNADADSAETNAKAAPETEDQAKADDGGADAESIPGSPEQQDEPAANPPPPPGSPDKVVSATELQPSSTETGAIPVGMSSPGARAAEFAQSSSGQTALGLMAVALLTASFLAYLRLHDRKPKAAILRHDLGAVSLGSTPVRRNTPATMPVKNALQPTPPTAPESEPIAPPEVPVAAPAPGSLSAAIENGAAGDWLPTSREDALAVLGASPDASLNAISKIVEGLRQSWHPDLAKDETDRCMRETRMKLINVAWDIIQKGPLA